MCDSYWVAPNKLYAGVCNQNILNGIGSVNNYQRLSGGLFYFRFHICQCWWCKTTRNLLKIRLTLLGKDHHFNWTDTTTCVTCSFLWIKFLSNLTHPVSLKSLVKTLENWRTRKRNTTKLTVVATSWLSMFYEISF